MAFFAHEKKVFGEEFKVGVYKSTVELFQYLAQWAWKTAGGMEIPYFWVVSENYKMVESAIHIPGYKGHLFQIPLSLEKWNRNPYLRNIKLGTELYFPHVPHPEDPSIFISLIYTSTGWTLRSLESVNAAATWYDNKTEYLSRRREMHYECNFHRQLTHRHVNNHLKKKWSKIKINKVNLLKYPDRPTYWVQNDIEYTTKEILSFVQHQSHISDVNSIPYLIGLLPISRHKKNDTTERSLELKTIHPICISIEDKLKIDISDLLTKQLPKIDPRSNHNFVLVVTTKDFEIRLVRLKNKKWKCVDKSIDINQLEKVII